MEILSFIVKGNVMKKIKSVEDFKKFLKENKELVLSNAVNANEVTIDDEWMQDSKWDEIYQKEVLNNAKV